jgi:hypothetical protein
MVKKLCLVLMIAAIGVNASAQDTTVSNSRRDRKESRRQQINAKIRQAEEGVLVFRKQSIFGIQAKTNGYGIFYELGFMKTTRKTNIFRIDITETKSRKEEKQLNNGFFFGNPYIFGKQNYFYPVTLGFGQQYIFGQKGNKNGVSVSGIYNAGLSIGLLRPYYLNVDDPSLGGRTIKYTQEDSALFLDRNVITGGGGFGKGWGEMKMKPGAFAKIAMRFDYGRFNEVVSGLEIGMSAEFYGSKIPIMLNQDKDKQLFFQGYISILFGRRK